MASTTADADRTVSRRPSAATVLRELVLWTGAALGVLSIACAAAAILLGVKPLIFMSGSMNPTIPTGSLALVIKTPIDNIKLGDVVSYETTLGLRITHRVIKVEVAGGHKVLTLKGDANKTADVEPVTQSTVDREFFAIPGLGYAMNAVMKPQWSFAGGALVGLLVSLGFRRRRDVQLAHDAEAAREEVAIADAAAAATDVANALESARDAMPATTIASAVVPSATPTVIINAGYERRAALARSRREADAETFKGIARFNGLDSVATSDHAG